MPRNAIGIVRVSQVAGRQGESFASPSEQADRIRQACLRDNLTLVEIIDELDVSGGTPLQHRAGLRQAIEAVEAGQAEVIVAAYFDRLVRSLRVQDELVSRVEEAGGQVMAVDVGAVTSGSAGQWLSGTMLGAVAEYQRRTTAERSGEAQARAVARGVLPYPNVPPGYLRDTDGRLVPDPELAPIVAEAFRMRADGAAIKEVRGFLTCRGVKRSFHGVQALLRSRVMLGEIHFGDLFNLEAHEPIIDRDTFAQVQRVVVPRGRRGKSFRLLARLGVLRCGTCGSRMVVGTGYNGRYHHYRCPPVGDCPRRVTISAHIAERVVVDAVREALSDVEGRASAEQHARNAEQKLERAQADLDAALRAFAGLADEPAARTRLAELATARDGAVEELDRLGGTSVALTLNASTDWMRLSADEQRGLIRAVVDQATVSPGGKGASRITVELVG